MFFTHFWAYAEKQYTNQHTVKKYEHLFFDLDRTLWDFEANSLDTLRTLFDKHNLGERGTFEDFLKTYHHHNDRLWALYRKGKIWKLELIVKRFYLALVSFGLYNKELAETMSQEYLRISPTQTRLFPNTLETLTHLQTKYKMHIITNGFDEVQFVKLKNSGLAPFFTEVITSEQAGTLKPNIGIFDYALKRTGAVHNNSLMIGDDEKTDIEGAVKAGWDTVFFNSVTNNTSKKATFNITNLNELSVLLQ